MGDVSPRHPPPPQEGSPTSSLLPIRILTHNIRFATDTPEKHECLWEDRFFHLSSHFKYHTRPHFSPDSTLVCMQEVLHPQLQDLVKHTFQTNDWTYVGVGRNDGKEKGEYSPIFFRQSAWKCLHFETVWLNETGEVGKKGWDASSVRILTCAVLESVLVASDAIPEPADPQQASSPPKKVILALNTHLDDQGEVSRREAAKVVLQVSARLRSEYSPQFTFLAGDLNSRPSGDAYHILNSKGSGFVDVRRLIPDDGNAKGTIYAQGNELTFTGFAGDGGAQGKHRIDFIHLAVDGGQDKRLEVAKAKQMVQAYAVLPSRFDDRIWMSDHRAVVVDLLVPFNER